MTETTRIIAGPFNRVEGDLEISLDIEDGQVAAAYANSPLFRGFEMMLRGKDPRDALTVTPRICGICSISQSAAAARSIAEALGIQPTEAGALTAALIHGVENVADHLTHFYLFFMPDFAKPVYQGRDWHEDVVHRFTAMKGAGAREAVKARAELLHVMGLLAGKWPHTLAIQPGGVTKAPDARDRIRILSTLRGFRRFLEEHLFGGPLEAVVSLDGEDALAKWRKEKSAGDMRLFLDIADDLALGQMGGGPDRFMSFGAYETESGHLFSQGVYEDGAVSKIDFTAIREHLGHSWMIGKDAHPFEGVTKPDEDMPDTAYSWCKAPRLSGQTVEVGALARQIVDGHPLARDVSRNGGNVRARVIGRLLEIARTVVALQKWAESISPNERFMAKTPRLRNGEGAGLVEAARGSLGHWLKAENGKIQNYQIIAPTTWNFSPRDDKGVAGPVEQALVGAPVLPGETVPISVQHIVRSFDPCMVCTVH